MSSKIRLGLAVMAYGGQVHSKHVGMWLRIGNTLAMSPDRFELGAEVIVDTNPVDRARNLAVAQCMVNRCDWMLMIDADTWIEEPATMTDAHAGTLALRMISDADRAGAAIVVAPVQRRVVPGTAERQLMIYRHVPTSTTPIGEAAVRFHPGGYTPFDHNPGAMVEIDAAATAVMAINLNWLAQHEIMFKFTDDRAEDINFCHDVKAAGGKILCDGRVRTGHQSKSVYLYSDEG